MSDERKNWLDRVGVIHLWNTIKAALDDKVDKIEGMGLSSNDFTTEDKEKLESLSGPALATSESDGLMSAADKIKLDTVEKGANNYAHPTYQEKEAGVYRISVDKLGHVASAEKMTDEELTAEGISPADHTHDLGKLADGLEVTTGAADDADIMVVGHDETDDSGVASRKYYRRTLSSIWDWIKNKADEVFAAKEHSHKIEDLTEYNSRIYDATVARTQRTVLAAPTDQDGVASFRALDKNDVGLENVDNTADSIKNVNSAAILSGFDSAAPSQFQGNQVGTFIHGENDSTTGAFAFRRDNPVEGQVSMIIDGRFYQDEGRYMVLDTNNLKDNLGSAVAEAVYPVGSIYMSVNSTSPASLFGGTWEQLKDRVLIGAGGSYGVNSTGGAASVSIGTANLPAHSAKIQFRDAYALGVGLNTFEAMSSSGCSFQREENGGDKQAQKLSCTTSGVVTNDALWYSNNGKGTALNNMPPYLGVYIQKRVS